jgi:DNA-directed RNA polymerase alpha subunit
MMEIVVDKLAHGKTLSEALKVVYTKRNVIIPQNEKLNGIKVSDLEMSSLAKNALMRNRLMTVGEVIEYASDNSVKKLKGFGVNSGVELFETILDLHWSHMTKEEQTDFLIDTVMRNEDYIKAELM